MLARTRRIVSGLITDPPSAWLALPVGFSLSVLIAAAFGGAVQEVARAGPPSVVFLAILLAAATSNGVICGYYVSLIVTFERQLRAEPSTNNEATTRQR